MVLEGAPFPRGGFADGMLAEYEQTVWGRRKSGNQSISTYSHRALTALQALAANTALCNLFLVFF